MQAPVIAFLIFAAILNGQDFRKTSAPPVPGDVSSGYLLGPGDQLTIWMLGVDEAARPVAIDLDGYIDLPMAGRIKAAGLTMGALKNQIVDKLKLYIKDPQCSITVSDFRSQSVSVLGAVKEAGIRQLQGNRRLVEVLSSAGGLATDAGQTVTVTRASGPLPLPGATRDEKTGLSTAEINIQDLMSGSRPELNIAVAPRDVISVERARMVYVLGEVGKPGVFPLYGRPDISVLQAVSMAGGFTRGASPGNARILRVVPGSKERREVAVNLKKVLDGKSGDVSLTPDDVLFVPNSLPKNASLRAIEAGIQVGTGILIWNRP
ncbi:MAG TPA: polysaccharide biosynthesis/export family protein [Bryobacteraceae bacterium]|nr:polysaccharide biosynthesis/export family protein [Bryobacteraceae bacterium]